ncbi:hypothetical protein C8R45DRAFT_269189 [Mycena sanguinolenta]|nr:hypothetical protein C8R45DRAFT_269189 [Mycena sanguinolenta]
MDWNSSRARARRDSNMSSCLSFTNFCTRACYIIYGKSLQDCFDLISIAAARHLLFPLVLGTRIKYSQYRTRRFQFQFQARESNSRDFSSRQMALALEAGDVEADGWIGLGAKLGTYLLRRSICTDSWTRIARTCLVNARVDARGYRLAQVHGGMRHSLTSVSARTCDLWQRSRAARVAPRENWRRRRVEMPAYAPLLLVSTAPAARCICAPSGPCDRLARCRQEARSVQLLDNLRSDFR